MEIAWTLPGPFRGQIQPLYHPGTMLMAGFLLGGVAQAHARTVGERASGEVHGVSAVGDEAAAVAPAPCDDKPALAQREQCFSSGRGGDPEGGRKLSFGGQPLAGREHSAHDRFGDAALDECSPAFVADRLKDGTVQPGRSTRAGRSAAGAHALIVSHGEGRRLCRRGGSIHDPAPLCALLCRAIASPLLRD